MSMPRWRRKNRNPEPVRPAPARLSSADDAPIGDPVALLSRAVTEAQEEAARWKRHAATYANDLDLAVQGFNAKVLVAEDRTRERDGAYRERAQLLAWLAALHPSSAVITPARDIDEDGWHLLYLVAGGWQMSWHIAPLDVPLFRHVELVEPSDPRAQWDGHGTEQKYQRLQQHVRLLALNAPRSDEVSTPVTTGPEVRSA
ncbi:MULTISPECIES: hypothetical protein [unclassified Streptomyces]|uniref:hypothetical protein n=1 Tax=unclassified Streptomyces TaxID=2593676 RepID=UPI0033A561F3